MKLLCYSKNSVLAHIHGLHHYIIFPPQAIHGVIKCHLTLDQNIDLPENFLPVFDKNPAYL